VQSTYVERCWTVMPALAYVASQAGEPLNLIEIGCSAGVLLAFDQYSYDLGSRGIVGSASAPLTLTGKSNGAPPSRIPAIARRTGIDLHPIDARSRDERRWLLALCLPELREQQARLEVALDVVSRTEIKMLQGDALERLPEALDATDGPVCVFHSVCLLYWAAEAKAALHALLRDTGRVRDIYRLGFELSDMHDAYHAGRGEVDGYAARPAGATFDVALTHYGRGEPTSRVLAHATPAFTSLYWLG
jgi:hypothetical protein